MNLIGRLIADPEILNDIGKKGNKLAKFAILVSRDYKSDDSDIFNCVAWNKRAELIEKYTNKGDLVYVSGPLHQRKYDKEGQKRIFYEINLQKIIFLKRSKNNQSEDYSGNYNNDNATKKDKSPEDFNKDDIDIQEDDLPF